ncbi:hypothetical protein HRG_014934 [Hirsutella rhossiliensis]
MHLWPHNPSAQSYNIPAHQLIRPCRSARLGPDTLATHWSHVLDCFVSLLLGLTLLGYMLKERFEDLGCGKIEREEWLLEDRDTGQILDLSAPWDSVKLVKYRYTMQNEGTPIEIHSSRYDLDSYNFSCLPHMIFRRRTAPSTQFSQDEKLNGLYRRVEDIQEFEVLESTVTAATNPELRDNGLKRPAQSRPPEQLNADEDIRQYRRVQVIDTELRIHTGSKRRVITRKATLTARDLQETEFLAGYLASVSGLSEADCLAFLQEFKIQLTAIRTELSPFNATPLSNATFSGQQQGSSSCVLLTDMDLFYPYPCNDYPAVFRQPTHAMAVLDPVYDAPPPLPPPREAAKSHERASGNLMAAVSSFDPRSSTTGEEGYSIYASTERLVVPDPIECTLTCMPARRWACWSNSPFIMGTTGISLGEEQAAAKMKKYIAWKKPDRGQIKFPSHSKTQYFGLCRRLARDCSQDRREMAAHGLTADRSRLTLTAPIVRNSELERLGIPSPAFLVEAAAEGQVRAVDLPRVGIGRRGTREPPTPRGEAMKASPNQCDISSSQSDAARKISWHLPLTRHGDGGWLETPVSTACSPDTTSERSSDDQGANAAEGQQTKKEITGAIKERTTVNKGYVSMPRSGDGSPFLCRDGGRVQVFLGPEDTRYCWDPLLFPAETGAFHTDTLFAKCRAYGEFERHRKGGLSSGRFVICSYQTRTKRCCYREASTWTRTAPRTKEREGRVHPAAGGKAKTLERLRRILRDIMQLKVYSQDIEKDNFRDGKLVDFGEGDHSFLLVFRLFGVLGSEGEVLQWNTRWNPLIKLGLTCLARWNTEGWRGDEEEEFVSSFESRYLHLHGVEFPILVLALAWNEVSLSTGKPRHEKQATEMHGA